MKKGNLENLYLILLNLHDLISVWNGRKFKIRFEGWRNNGAITLFVAIRLSRGKYAQGRESSWKYWSVSNDSWLMVIRKIGGGGWRDNNESDAWLDFIADPVSIYLVPRLFVEADLCSFAVRRKGSFPTRRNNEVQTERSVGRKIKLERKK